jgi:anti-sigma factor ChrR (cupin superfamily)
MTDSRMYDPTVMTGDDVDFQDRMAHKAISPEDSPDVVRAKVLDALRDLPRADESMPQPECSFTVRGTDAPWKTIGPGTRMRRLKRDDRILTFLMELEPQAVVAAHDHEGGEDSFVVRGSCRIGGLSVTAGDFHHSDAGSHHGDVIAGPEGCLLLITLELPDVP